MLLPYFILLVDDLLADDVEVFAFAGWVDWQWDEQVSFCSAVSNYC